MARPREEIPTFLWLDPAQGPLMAALVRAAGLGVIAWGCPPTNRPAEQPTGAIFDPATRVSDARLALATLPMRVALLASVQGANGSTAPDAPEGDADLIRLCRTRDVALLSMEPMPASVTEAATGDGAPWADAARFIAPFRRAPGLRGIAELLESFGPARTLSVAFRCGPGQGTLGARLFDAMHLVHAVLGTPESIDASVVTQVAPSGVRLAPGEGLRTLRGDMTANLRFAGARAAALSLSDRAGRWFRGVALIGENGCLRMDESGLERIDAQGQTVERSAPPPEPGAPDLFEGWPDAGALRALSEGVKDALDPGAARPDPLEMPRVLAMCEAAILSARTGQPESPATIARMV